MRTSLNFFWFNNRESIYRREVTQFVTNKYLFLFKNNLLNINVRSLMLLTVTLNKNEHRKKRMPIFVFKRYNIIAIFMTMILSEFSNCHANSHYCKSNSANDNR